ncbi:3-keto-disaccharide hydrolase [Thermopirellula anaerolimosa]
MLRTFSVVLTLVLSIGLAGNVPAEPSAGSDSTAGEVRLFNGRNLDGWDFFVIDPGKKIEDVWSVRDGLLVTQGEPLGYLFTKGKYKNFRLTVEWRWEPGTEPGNSGVLLRIAGDPVSFLPKCVEAQLQSGSAGDIWAFYGAALRGDPARFRKITGHEKIGDFVGVGKIKAAENPPGEWNRYEIELVGPKLTLWINGQKVNEAEGLDVAAGPIGLQSEGGRIQFRTVTLKPLAD